MSVLTDTCTAGSPTAGAIAIFRLCVCAALLLRKSSATFSEANGLKTHERTAARNPDSS